MDEEQKAEERAEGHVSKNSRQDGKDQARAGGGLKAQGKDGRQDGAARQNSGKGVQPHHNAGVLDDVGILFQIAAIGDGDAHPQAEAEENLAHGLYHGIA